MTLSDRVTLHVMRRKTLNDGTFEWVDAGLVTLRSPDKLTLSYERLVVFDDPVVGPVELLEDTEVFQLTVVLV